MIYCVEDDKDIMQIMLYTLKSRGYDAHGFENGNDFWQAVEKEKPQIVLLDIMLPGEDGLSILNRLRRREDTKDVYIIMTTAKGSEYDKVIGFDSGADFYLTKPFGMLEMLAHIRAVLRRGSKITGENKIKLGKIEIDTASHSVKAAGREISLTVKEYEILSVLAKNSHKVFTREELLEKVWGYDWMGETRTVDVHVAALRTKLGKYGEYIETIRGIGYKMGNKNDKTNF